MTGPAAAPYINALRAHLDNLRKKGVADYYIGRLVRRLVEDLGFTDVQHEGWTILLRKGDSYADWWTTMWAIAGRALLEGGIILQEYYDTRALSS